jgi:uncharacterized protein YjbI with pentapeptide repeats
MSKPLRVLRNPTFFVAALMAIIMSIGATLWFAGPTQSNKFTDLGANLCVGAIVGLGLIAIERLISQSAAERDEAAAEERRFLASLLATEDLSGVRLRGRVLSSVMMSGRILNGADLSGATLDRADLRRASLAQAVLEGAKAFDANFADANLRGAIGLHFFAQESSFDRANCTESNWSDSRFQDCSLVEAKLFRAILTSADFSSCQLKKADLGRSEGADVNFSCADLRATSFSGAQLSRPDFSNADMRGADFTGAIFNEPNLCGADLRDCRGADLALRNPRTDTKTRMADSISVQTNGAD